DRATSRSVQFPSPTLRNTGSAAGGRGECAPGPPRGDAHNCQNCELFRVRRTDPGPLDRPDGVADECAAAIMLQYEGVRTALDPPRARRLRPETAHARHQADRAARANCRAPAVGAPAPVG